MDDNISLRSLITTKLGVEPVDIFDAVDPFSGDKRIYAQLPNGTKVEMELKLKVMRCNGPIQRVSDE